MGERGGVVEMAGQGIDDLVCADIVVEVDMLAIMDGLGGIFGGGQWDAFLYRLADEKGVLGKRCLWQSRDRATQDPDSGGTGHLLVMWRRIGCRDSTVHYSPAKKDHKKRKRKRKSISI